MKHKPQPNVTEANEERSIDTVSDTNQENRNENDN
jgi:hypothetical protein